MSRSLKKGPFVDIPLLEKVEHMNNSGDRRVIKSWSRTVDGHPRDDRSHYRGAQREEVHPGIPDREHGGAQAG